jgi:hypothetical protein
MMRLTLRTLLAYLDDVLAPADTKVIGQKIQESPMAQLLVSRIREVMRRRRLKAPEVFGPEMGIDPNIVAQYLDNSLPADRYADVERVLLASDEMLAEAAACHQVLTLILADPSEVPVVTRERLYALGPVEVTSQLAVPGDTSLTVKARTPESISTRDGSSTSFAEPLRSSSIQDEAITTVPDYLKPTPWSKRVFPSAIVALLVIVCVALLVPGVLTLVRQANNEIQRKAERQKGASTASTDEAPDPGAIVADAGVIDAASRPRQSPHTAMSSPSVLPTLAVNVDPNPPLDEVDGFLPPAPNPAPKRPEVDVPADGLIPIAPVKSDTAPEPALGPKPKPPAPEVPVTYASNDGILVRLDDVHQHWFMTPHRSAMKPGEIVASVEPFDSTLDFDRGSVRVTLVGETVAQMLIPSDMGPAGVGIRRGRVVFQSGRPEGSPPVAIGIAIGEDTWTLDLETSDTVCALEVTPRESTQFQQLHDYHWYQATLYVISGSVKWTNLAKKSQQISDHTALNIIPERDATVRSNPISFPSAPDWCEPAKRKAMPLRRYQSVFEKAFELDQPVELSMRTLVKNTNPKIAELAARCLAATDNYAALAQTLAECQHEEARFAARDGLREWLPLHTDNGPKLRKELETHYPPADAEAVYQMLWGFSRDDIKDSKGVALLFTTWMRNHRLEIRELADYWVERLTGKKTEYRASGVASQRESQVRRIEEQIERDNGLIKAQ